MKRRLQWAVGGLAALLAVTGFVAVVLVERWTRPQPPAVEVRKGEFYVETIRRSRSRELLPLAQWGFESMNVIGCGGTSTVVSNSQKYGFFVVSDVEVSTGEPVSRAGR